MPEWIAIWARQAPVFADLTRIHPEVVERLHALIRFREAKPRLLVAQATRAMGTRCRRCTPRKAVSTAIRSASRHRKTALRRTARMPEVRAAIKHMRTRFALGNEKLWKTLRRAGHQISMASVGAW